MAGTIAGSLVFDTKTNTKGFERGLNNIDKKIGNMRNSFGKLGATIIATFSINALKNFGLSIVETTADLQAMDAQFEQIFKGSEGEAAMKAINTQSEELGIHVNRLTGSFNKFGAQLKGAGLDGKKALEGTSKATELAADAAAFYDVSLENSSASLASFLKGNFEAGDAIGVFTNATQMSVKANEMYGKSWDKLTEAEKQWLLLDKVSSVYELNGAVGQSKREADNWTNSVENLKTAWGEIKETIGSNFLNNVTGAVQGITSALEGLTEMMQNNPEATKAFMDALIAFLAALSTYLITKNISMMVLGLSKALGTFDAALLSPAGKAALFAAALYELYQIYVRLVDVWDDMSGFERLGVAIAAVGSAYLIAAMAAGSFSSAISMGAAAVGIAAGIGSILAAITAAEQRTRSIASKNSVPRLATGAVIPPNGEFMAVLGDQKHGRNLEAPEGLIRQIMREELGSRNNGGGNATVILEMDGRELARGTAPYNAGETSRRGVRLIKGLT